MAGRKVREALQPFVTNPLPPTMDAAEIVCGIVGETPSRTARSPLLWNAAFRALGWNATFVAFDVAPGGLPAFVEAARGAPGLRGLAVAVPYKIDVVPLLDGADAEARDVGSVNTIVAADGRLEGGNTDGSGFVASLTRPLAGQTAPFLGDLRAKRALVLGAGGAARAIAFRLADAVGPSGAVGIVNRDAAKARALAAAVERARGNCFALSEAEMAEALATTDLLVNASTRGQAGIRRVQGGSTCLEPYSALGPAAPAVLPDPAPGAEAAFYRAWWAASREDVLANLRAGGEAVARLPAHAAVVDAVFSPPETPFLRDARLSGLRTLNGRGMSLYQAVEAFARRVLPGEFKRHGLTAATGERLVLEAMSAAG